MPVLAVKPAQRTVRSTSAQRCPSDTDEDSDPTGDDRSDTRPTRTACRSAGGNDNDSGGDEVGDVGDAGDGRDDQAGDSDGSGN